jgi:hypothetical protein
VVVLTTGHTTTTGMLAVLALREVLVSIPRASSYSRNLRHVRDLNRVN